MVHPGVGSGAFHQSYAPNYRADTAGWMGGREEAARCRGGPGSVLAGSAAGPGGRAKQWAQCSTVSAPRGAWLRGAARGSSVARLLTFISGICGETLTEL
ncbi:unnamed protein product [Natator depressus]